MWEWVKSGAKEGAKVYVSYTVAKWLINGATVSAARRRRSALRRSAKAKR
jgi:hypothetical protein